MRVRPIFALQAALWVLTGEVLVERHRTEGAVFSFGDSNGEGGAVGSIRGVAALVGRYSGVCHGRLLDRKWDRASAGVFSLKSVCTWIGDIGCSDTLNWMEKVMCFRRGGRAERGGTCDGRGVICMWAQRWACRGKVEVRRECSGKALLNKV